MTDLSTGLYAHGAILAAVLQRQITGKGQHIDCNLFSTQVNNFYLSTGTCSWKDQWTGQSLLLLLYMAHHPVKTIITY
jgi:hypothetical protein